LESLHGAEATPVLTRGALTYGHRSFGAERRAANMLPSLNQPIAACWIAAWRLSGIPSHRNCKQKSGQRQLSSKNLFCREIWQQPSRRNDLRILPLYVSYLYNYPQGATRRTNVAIRRVSRHKTDLRPTIGCGYSTNWRSRTGSFSAPLGWAVASAEPGGPASATVAGPSNVS